MKNIRYFIIIVLAVFITALFPESKKGTLNVLSPNGGETFHNNGNMDIRWSFTTNKSGNNFVIILYKEGVKFFTISSNTGSPGHFIWHIPENFKEGSHYRIRIRLRNNLSVNDFSDSDFSITKK